MENRKLPRYKEQNVGSPKVEGSVTHLKNWKKKKKLYVLKGGDQETEIYESGAVK